jgi:DNA repair exonuclease SbcCD ATPase subunit
MNPTEATERIEELEKAFEKLEITAKACASREAALRSTIAELQRENLALREKVDDWENAVAHALDHRPDEQHCTCVAPLVGKVKQLERETAALRSAAVEVCALARVWATVWHDKLSTESIQRFAELEQQLLKEAQP